LSIRRRPSEIAFELLNAINSDRATKWELTKILGNTAQFRHWVEDFLLKDKLVEESMEGRVTYYSLTVRGELLYSLLKNGDVMRSILRLSGKRLNSDG
jgi:predicted transcriptional regulator